jgi:hypothetical protein
MNHTIVAMVGDKVVRVECNTCHGIHSYRAVKPAKEPAIAKGVAKKPAVPRSAKPTPEALAAAEWAELTATVDPAQAVPYAMTVKFRVNTPVLHPTFGLGIVQQLLPPNKIAVLFQDGKRLLRCG